MDSYTPEAAAAIVGNVSASTIRNWCTTYKPLLSDGANPTTGSARRLTEQDVAILQQVKLLRDNRQDVATILATLQQPATKPPTVTTTIDVAPQSPPSHTDAHSDALHLPIVLSALTGRQDATDAHIQATDKRVDALERAIEQLGQRQGERTNVLVTGIVIGCAVMLIAVALVLWWQG